MKLIRLLGVPALMVALLSSCNEGDNAPLATDVPSTDVAKVSYAIGQNMANGLKSAGFEYDTAYLFSGFLDALADKQSLTDEEMQASLTAMQTQMQQKQMEAYAKELEANSAAGQAYLTENAAKEGVVTTESGLQYRVIEAGEGVKPTAEDTVTVNYEGRLIDGTVFDSSYERGEPATFPLGGVIAGWTEGLQLMSIGSKFEFTVPADLAYGQRGSPPRIGPNTTLIFTVELLGVESANKDAS